MSKGKFSYAFKVATTICCLVGLISSFIGSTNIMSTLSYYTTLSNIIVLIFYISICLILPFKKNADKTQSYAQIKGAVVMIIFLTFMVYSISLQPLGFAMGADTPSADRVFRLSNIFVHFITPIMVFLDYFIFDFKGNYKYSYVPLWTLFPALYPVYAYIYAELGGRYGNVGGSIKYAYFFLDKDEIGVEGVVGYLALIWVIYEMCCLAYVFIDHTLKKRKDKRNKLCNS